MMNCVIFHVVISSLAHLIYSAHPIFLYFLPYDIELSGFLRRQVLKIGQLERCKQIWKEAAAASKNATR